MTRPPAAVFWSKGIRVILLSTTFTLALGSMVAFVLVGVVLGRISVDSQIANSESVYSIRTSITPPRAPRIDTAGATAAMIPLLHSSYGSERISLTYFEKVTQTLTLTGKFPRRSRSRVLFVDQNFTDVFQLELLRSIGDSVIRPGELWVSESLLGELIGSDSNEKALAMLPIPGVSLANGDTYTITGIFEDRALDASVPFDAIVLHSEDKTKSSSADPNTWFSITGYVFFRLRDEFQIREHEIQELLNEVPIALPEQASLSEFLKVSVLSLRGLRVAKSVKGELREPQHSLVTFSLVALLGIALAISLSIGTALWNALHIRRAVETKMRFCFGETKSVALWEEFCTVSFTVVFSIIVPLIIYGSVYSLEFARLSTEGVLIPWSKWPFLIYVLLHGATLWLSLFLVGLGMRQKSQSFSASSPLTLGAMASRKIGLVIAIAIAFVLVVQTASLQADLSDFRGRDPGYRTDSIYVVPGITSSNQISNEQASALVEQIRSVTGGVVDAALSSAIPTQGVNSSVAATISGHLGEVQVQIISCTNNLANLLDIQTLGELPSMRSANREESDSSKYVTVNDALSRGLGLDESSKLLGKTIRIPYADTNIEYVIARVVRNARWSGHDVDPLPTVYVDTPATFDALLLSVPNQQSYVRIRDFFLAKDLYFSMLPLEELRLAQIAGVILTLRILFVSVILILATIAIGTVIISTAYVRRHSRELGLRLVAGSSASAVSSRFLAHILGLLLIGLSFGYLVSYFLLVPVFGFELPAESFVPSSAWITLSVIASALPMTLKLRKASVTDLLSPMD